MFPVLVLREHQCVMPQSVTAIDAWREGEREAPDEKTFFAVSQKDGKNSKGQIVSRPKTSEGAPAWERTDHDLGDVVAAYREFTEREPASKTTGA